jgi:hypothetical protein
MSVVITLSIIATMCVLVALGRVVDNRGAVGLISGYDAGHLPLERERELARDVRNVLVVSAVLLLPILVDSLILTLPPLLLFGIPVVGTLVFATGLIWRYNDLSG